MIPATGGVREPGGIQRARLPAVNRINRRGVVVIAAVASSVPLLAGCYNGFDAQTNIQPPSGDGTSAQIGDVMIRSAAWVRSETDPRTLTLSSNFVNAGLEPDQLVSVVTEPIGKVALTGSMEMKPLSEIRTGYNSDKYIDATETLVGPSSYVSTTFNFKRAGSITLSILTVPPTGYFAGIRPGGAPAPSPSGSGSKSAKPSASESASPTTNPSTSVAASPQGAEVSH